MYSIRSNIKDALIAHRGDFSIHLGTIETSFGVTPKDGVKYPRITISEPSNLPNSKIPAKGETRTLASYQLDIVTKDSIIAETGNVINRSDAALLLAREIDAFLDTMFKLTRTFTTELPFTPDAVRYILRSQCIIDEYGYTYRPNTF